MPRQILNLGTPTRGVSAPGAENRYESFRKCDENFAEIYPVFDAAKAGIVAHSTKTAAYTFVLADAGTVVEGNSASALTFTVPANATAAFPIGCTIQIRQAGGGQVTTAPVDGTVVLRTSSSLTTRTTWSSLVLHKRATDEWIVDGDTA